MATVAVTIVSYQTAQLTQRAASSALDAGADEVVIVDNGSRDSTLLDLKSLPDPRLAVHTNTENMGFGSAGNSGARAATGEWLMFLNSDAELTRAALEEIISELRRWDGRAMVGPRLVGRDQVIQRSAGLLPRPADLITRALGIHTLGRALAAVPLARSLVGGTQMAREHASAETATETIDTNMVSGACFAIGRDAFWELGGFDERFFMYFEDADLCKRAAAAGMPIRYVPSAVVTHIGGASSEGDYHFSPMHARSMRQYLEKWWGSPGVALAILLLWLRLIGHALVLHPGTGKAFAALRAALRP